MAAHTQWTPERIAEAMDVICDAIARKKGIREASALAGVGVDTVYRWMDADPAIAERYAQARERRADARSDHIDEIVSKCATGEIKSDVARVMIDAEKWQASKENARRYGDRLQLDGDLNVTITDAQLESRLSHLLGKAGAAAASGGAGETEAPPQVPLALPSDGPAQA